jgi:hypothetical protein
VVRAAQWTAADLGQRNAAVLPFERAFALRTLLVGSSEPASHRSTLALLLGSQGPDGSWDPSARLRIPPPEVVDPDRYEAWAEGGRGGGSVQSDHNACFTTAAVLLALAAARDDSAPTGGVLDDLERNIRHASSKAEGHSAQGREGVGPSRVLLRRNQKRPQHPSSCNRGLSGAPSPANPVYRLKRDRFAQSHEERRH